MLLARGRLLLCLRVMLLVNDTRGSRVEVLLGRRRTLLLVVGMMVTAYWLFLEVARHLTVRSHGDRHAWVQRQSELFDLCRLDEKSFGWQVALLLPYNR
jgi:hypothetical protein